MSDLLSKETVDDIENAAQFVAGPRSELKQACKIVGPRSGSRKQTQSDYPWHLCYDGWTNPASIAYKTQIEASSALYYYLEMYNARDPGSSCLSQFQIVHESNLPEINKKTM